MCAKKARWLRMTQRAESWHREDEPEQPEGDDLENTIEEDGADDAGRERQVRSTRHRQDVSDLPRVPIQNHTVGRTFTAPSGVTYRPSVFVTPTLPSYGKVITGRGQPWPPPDDT